MALVKRRFFLDMETQALINQALVAHGVVREGLVVPLGDEELPEGAHVEIRVIAGAPESANSEALTDAERWRRFSESSGVGVDWDELD